MTVHIFATLPAGNVPASYLDDNFAVGGSYTPAGTGAVATTVAAKLQQTVSVIDFGATTSDSIGSTNVAAFNAALATGLAVYVPQGIYTLNATLTILAANVDQVIYGDSKSLSVLRFVGTANGLDFTNVAYARPKLRNISLRAGSLTCGTAIKFGNYNQSAGNGLELDIDVSCDNAYTGSPTGLWAYGLWANALQTSKICFSAYQSCTVPVHFEGYVAAVDFYSPNIVGAPSLNCQRAFECDMSVGSYASKLCFVNIYGGILQGNFTKSVLYVNGGAMRFYDTFIENHTLSPSDGGDFVFNSHSYKSILSGCLFSWPSGSIVTEGTPTITGALLIESTQVNSITISGTDYKTAIYSSAFNTLTVSSIGYSVVDSFVLSTGAARVNYTNRGVQIGGLNSVGVPLNSYWGSSGANGFQVGSYASLSESETSGALQVSCNTVQSNSTTGATTYISTGAASRVVYNFGSIQWQVAPSGSAGTAVGAAWISGLTLNLSGSLSVLQAPTTSAPTYLKGAMYFDTTLNKLRIGGATAWETVTSV